MGRSVFRLSELSARMPAYDTSDNTDWAQWGGPGTPEPAPQHPELNPFRGTRTLSYGQIVIRGQAVIPLKTDLPAGAIGVGGPAEGDLMILWLQVRDGFVNMNAQWSQYKNSISNGVVFDTYTYDGPGTGTYTPTYAPTGAPSSQITGGWTKFVTVDHGGNGPKIFGYYRKCSAAEAASATWWVIPLVTSGRLFIQVHAQFIAAQIWREPFNPVISKRTYVNTLNWRVPGVRTPVNPDVDAAGTNFAGGNLILSTVTVVGPFSSTRPGGEISMIPGSWRNETYGGWRYHVYDAPYGWGWSWAYTGGLPDDVIVPDGEPNVQATSDPLHIACVTLAIPSAPNLQYPDGPTAIGGFTNNFEVDNLNSFFTTTGSGTPWIE